VKSTYRSKQYRRKLEESRDDTHITHTSYAPYYHIVWAVKKRFPLIESSIRADLEESLREKCQELEVHLLAVGINPEHVHCILSLKPIHYVPEVVGELKGFFAHEINGNGEEYLKWARGYSVRTVSEKNLSAAIEYVKNQKRHHYKDFNG
jgi:putative transposase